MDLATWKEAFRAGTAPADTVLFKQYSPDSIKAEGNDQYSFVISTGAVDRDKDTVAPDGWKLDRYRKNPVVLWAHDSRSLPIGKAETVLASGSALKARIKFAPTEFAETVRRLVDGGFIRATSVGFIADKAKFNDERGGVDFESQELLEFSLVPVPSNPDALIDAKHAGIDVAPLKEWAVRILDGVEPGLWLPKDVAARALKIAGGEPATVTVAANPFTAEADAKAIEFHDAIVAFEKAIVAEKRGRTLSAANEGRIRSAKESLDAVLSSMPPEDDDDEDDKAPHVIRFAPSKALPITKSEVIAAVQSAVSQAAKSLVNQATGRLD